jgi:glutathione synthase/RimK-type ligase-like ATP-grasp enzyme
MFNREMSPAASNKPASLVAARRAGLPIPSTLITNQAEMLREERFQSMVAKPVLGGDYCYPLGRH